MVNFTIENKTYCFRIGPAVLDTHINLFQDGSNQKFVGLGLPVYGLATPLRLSYE